MIVVAFMIVRRALSAQHEHPCRYACIYEYINNIFHSQPVAAIMNSMSYVTFTLFRFVNLESNVTHDILYVICDMQYVIDI